MTSITQRLLLTGATGFIGGTVLNTFIKSSASSLRGSPISYLLRGKDRAAKLSAVYGDRVDQISYEGLDDLEKTTDAKVVKAAMDKESSNVTIDCFIPRGAIICSSEVIDRACRLSLAKPSSNLIVVSDFFCRIRR